MFDLFTAKAKSQECVHKPLLKRKESRPERNRTEVLLLPGSRPGLPVPNSPGGLCGRKATLNLNSESQELCESRGGRPDVSNENN